MSGRLRINALVVCILAALFYLFFMASKHVPALSSANAFAEDPYDAVGSFGIQAAALLCILSLLRAFRPYRARAPSEEQKEFLGRTQMLAVLAVAVTLACDIVAMARYPSIWIGSTVGKELAALAGFLALFAILPGILVHYSLPEKSLRARPGAGKRAVAVSLVGILILAIYPDTLRQSTLGALLTVIVGAILLFAPMWAWGIFLVPYGEKIERKGTRVFYEWWRNHKSHLGLVILFGAILGILLLSSEFIIEGGGNEMNMARLAFIASIYIGLETTGLLIGYGLLSRPLGLFQRKDR